MDSTSSVSVTASYRSDHDGNATDLDDNTSWRIWQTSGNDLSGTANAYCVAVSAP
jgi:hypothetical protein